ncbi:uncharacterized protein AB675_2597 [Cyphellophora attinorum]|uniref:Uncharacterized protein n=1 Tax=Cyphellophora attinorum TaxID=1664694 RepID=A0A0N1P3D3_9EURO|nr:uncharacterized protein AB675_2597 [Phialophora attinorum]KPI45315.1 hypothetical protein AB675_2597 [Phialophora attinorum]
MAYTQGRDIDRVGPARDHSLVVSAYQTEIDDLFRYQAEQEQIAAAATQELAKVSQSLYYLELEIGFDEIDFESRRREYYDLKRREIVVSRQRKVALRELELARREEDELNQRESDRLREWKRKLALRMRKVAEKWRGLAQRNVDFARKRELGSCPGELAPGPEERQSASLQEGRQTSFAHEEGERLVVQEASITQISGRCTGPMVVPTPALADTHTSEGEHLPASIAARAAPLARFGDSSAQPNQIRASPDRDEDASEAQDMSGGESSSLSPPEAGRRSERLRAVVTIGRQWTQHGNALAIAKPPATVISSDPRLEVPDASALARERATRDPGQFARYNTQPRHKGKGTKKNGGHRRRGFVPDGPSGSS